MQGQQTRHSLSTVTGQLQRQQNHFLPLSRQQLSIGCLFLCMRFGVEDSTPGYMWKCITDVIPRGILCLSNNNAGIKYDQTSLFRDTEHDFCLSLSHYFAIWRRTIVADVICHLPMSGASVIRNANDSKRLTQARVGAQTNEPSNSTE